MIGFGNIYRRDDGVGFAVINALRERLKMPPLGIQDDGFNDLGHDVDTVVVHQLVPELAEVVARYDRIVFVDAHISSIPDSIKIEEVAICYKTTSVLHQLHPCALLALTYELYNCAPHGILVSVRGGDFDFGEGLSEQTAALVPKVVKSILTLQKKVTRSFKLNEK